jgi:cation diffusion facilitator CzcD-associated flavoprotein CzcO
MDDGREISADVIIYATGFAATDGIAPVRVCGVSGIDLMTKWSGRIQAYLGTCVAGFPNLFMVIGPNTGLGHNSMIFMMEAQYRYIIGAIKHLERSKKRAIDVRPDVMQSFNNELQRRLKGTVWETGCSSWYQDARGNNVALWPGFTFAFRRRTSRFDPRNYRTM